MEFIVPKFIEREARVAGPLTFKQLVIFIITAAIIFVLYKLFPRTIFFIFSILLVLLSLALAFGKMGGRPLLLILANAFRFLFSSKIFIWKKGGKSTLLQKLEIKKEEKELPFNIIKDNRLKRLKTKIETKAK
jgi:hypothetical protein